MSTKGGKVNDDFAENVFLLSSTETTLNHNHQRPDNDATIVNNVGQLAQPTSSTEETTSDNHMTTDLQNKVQQPTSRPLPLDDGVNSVPYSQAQQHVHFDINLPLNSQPYGSTSAEMRDNSTFDGSEDTTTNPVLGPAVQCRVCEADITLDGKNGQHVVRCLQCNEVTPVRAAPPGRKYVRCPCNCLLVCKATSTRIACPRQNCRRVITLASGPPNSGIPGTAIRAPVGTCRVQCAYCQEVFMFNTLTNQLAICPHCRKSSSVGTRFARSRCILSLIGLFLASIFLLGLIAAISHGQTTFFMWVFLIVMSSLSIYLTYRSVYFWRIGISQILGPL